MNKVGVCMSKNGRVGFSCIYLPISFYRDVCCCNLMMFYDCRECESRTGIVLCYVTGTMTTDWYCSVLCDGNDGYTGIALCYVTGTMTTD